jgi:hypothetical protein
VTLTLADRVDAYKRAFPQWPQSWPWIVQEGAGAHRHDVAYGVWKIGQDYRNKSRFYGAYPHGYLDRVMAFFPDLTPASPKSAVMHVFSGSLPPGHYERVDVLQDADTQCDVLDLPNIVLNHRPFLIIADPPYSPTDAGKYGTPMVNRGKALRALAQVIQPGGWLVWLDTVWPMHSKDEWVSAGSIGLVTDWELEDAEWMSAGLISLVRSTNHRVRLVSIFQRRAA